MSEDISSNEADDLDEALFSEDVKVKGETRLGWFQVASMGSGEMIFAAAWAWIAVIGLTYGAKISLMGFFLAALIVIAAWYLYREMISAVPEPGMLQSYAREAGIFSLGTAYFLLYPFVYAGYMWVELQIVTGFLSSEFGGVPKWVWPLALMIPILLINLFGHQITGRLTALLVGTILAADLIVGVMLWLAFDPEVWSANWGFGLSGGQLTLIAVAGATAMWVAIMTGIMEVQQVVVDEWEDFERSRDVGLPAGVFQMIATQAILGFAMMGVMPLADLAQLPLPILGATENVFGRGLLWAAVIIFLMASTWTTFAVYYMGMGRILALYSMQGGLPRIFAQYSSRAVPWFSLVFLTLLALAGAYWTDWAFIQASLATWGVTTYALVALIFLLMRRNRTLERPVTSRFGVPVAIILLLWSTIVAWALIETKPSAALLWFGLVAGVVAYDHFIVPRTPRGKHYREQLLRRRTDATQL